MVTEDEIIQEALNKVRDEFEKNKNRIVPIDFDELFIEKFSDRCDEDRYRRAIDSSNLFATADGNGYTFTLDIEGRKVHEKFNWDYNAYLESLIPKEKPVEIVIKEVPKPNKWTYTSTVLNVVLGIATIYFMYDSNQIANDRNESEANKAALEDRLDSAVLLINSKNQLIGEQQLMIELLIDTTEYSE